MLTKLISVCRMVWDLIWGTCIYIKSKTKIVKSKKMCHVSQLLLATVFNSPIYTSILHAQVLNCDDYLCYLKSSQDKFWKWLNSKMNDKQIYVTNWKQFVLIFWAVWDLQWLRSTWVCNIPGPTEHMEALRIRPLSLFYDKK